MKFRIKEARRAKGLSQSELAEKLDATLSMVGKLERGEREVTITWLERIASALEVDALDLMESEDVSLFIGSVTPDGSIVPAKIEQRPWGEVSNEAERLSGLTQDVQFGGVATAGGEQLYNLPIEDTNHRRSLQIEVDASVRLPKGSLITYSRLRAPSGILNRLAVVSVLEKPLDQAQIGVPYVGTLIKGSAPRKYHLLAFDGGIREDVLVHWAAPIEEIKIP